jgi:hypothetical protein
MKEVSLFLFTALKCTSAGKSDSIHTSNCFDAVHALGANAMKSEENGARNWWSHSQKKVHNDVRREEKVTSNLSRIARVKKIIPE